MPRPVFPYALMVAALLVLTGCDTRPTCEVVCSNEVRCGFSPVLATCTSMCGSNIAMSTPDCRVATDTYHRCWSAQNNCPASRTTAAPGCNAELDEQSLACLPRL